MRNFSKNNGFTLLEVLLYLAIASVLVTVFAGLLFISGRTQLNHSLRQSLDSEVEHMDSLLTRSVRNASSIEEPSLGEESERLELITGTSTEQTIVWFVEAGRLYLEIEREDPVAVTSEEIEISNLLFRNLGEVNTNGSIQILADVMTRLATSSSIKPLSTTVNIAATPRPNQ